MLDRPQIVFVHGLFSSGDVWDRFITLLQGDETLGGVDCIRYEYSSPRLLFSIRKRIPSFDDLADRFRTFIEASCDAGRPMIIVTHSQGGLIVQRFLARSLDSELKYILPKIKLIVMFSCPNSGSDILLSMRKMLVIWRHSQEKELRPLNRLVTETRRTVLRKIINARPNDPTACRIPIYFYAGDTDNVVTSVSAFDVFPIENTGVVQGDHSSIIQPGSADDESYKVLTRRIRQVIENAQRPLTTEGNGADLSVEQVDQSLNVQELLEKARQYDNEGLNRQAEATYIRAASSGDLDALQDYSRFQRRQGDLSGSIDTSSRIVDILVNLDDTVENRVHQSRVMATIGIAHRNLGRLQQSEKSLREAIRAVQGNTETEAKARAYALDNLGITFMRATDMRAARTCFDDALDEREKLEDEVGRAHSLINIARLDMREGRLKDALEGCEKAMSLLDQRRDTAAMASAISIRGEIAYINSDLITAEKDFSDALKLNESMGRSVAIALSQQQLARALFEKGDEVKAETYARKALENYQSSSNVEGEVGANQILARIANSKGDADRAIAILEECIATSSGLGNLTSEAWSTLYLAEVLYQLGRPDAGAARLERAAVLADSIDNASLRRSVEQFTATRS